MENWPEKHKDWLSPANFDLYRRYPSGRPGWGWLVQRLADYSEGEEPVEDGSGDLLDRVLQGPDLHHGR